MLLEGSPKSGAAATRSTPETCVHARRTDVLVDTYPEEEYWQDLLKVTGGITNEKLARIVIRASSKLP